MAGGRSNSQLGGLDYAGAALTRLSEIAARSILTVPREVIDWRRCAEHRIRIAQLAQNDITEDAHAVRLAEHREPGKRGLAWNSSEGGQDGHRTARHSRARYAAV